MNKQILGLDTGAVAFTHGSAGAGTVVISSMTGFSVARVLAITNVTKKTLIYVPEGGTGLGGVWSSVSGTGGTLTLDIDTSLHSDADVLRVLYGVATFTDGTQQTKITDGTNAVSVSTVTGDGVSATLNRMRTSTVIHGFNGTTWDSLRCAVTGATGTFTGLLSTLTGGLYRATPLTLTDGQYSPISLTADQSLRTAASAGGFVDGSIATIGLKADTAATDSTSSWTSISLLKGLWAKLPTLVSGKTPVDPSGQGYTGTATITRAANQTVYSINDVVGGALTIANAGASGGKVFITGVDIIFNIAALPAGMTSLRLYFYDATPPSAIADNGVFTFGSGDRASFLGFIDIGTPVLLGTGTGSPQVQLDNINKAMTLNASTSLFAYLVTNGAYTPAANSETYTLRVQTISR